jgi:hypothetical protein
MTDRATERTARIVALLHEKVRLEPFHRRLFYSVFGVLWGSGALWLLIEEWFKDPEIGATRTLLQIFAMEVHGAVMLVFLLMLGTLFAHVRRGLILKTNRLSGWCIIGLNALMALTGWLLYYVSDDTARAWSSVIHWSVGLAALPALYTHILLGRTSTAALGDNETSGAQPNIRKTRASKNQRNWG